MSNTTQKINLMSALTNLGAISDKILDNSSLKNKEILKIIKSNSKQKCVHKSI